MKTKRLLPYFVATALAVVVSATLVKRQWQPASEGALELTSYNPPTTQTLRVVYPSHARVDFPNPGKRSEILVNPQPEGNVCEISELASPAQESAEEDLCRDLPDACWINQTFKVSRDSDPTCAQAFRGQEILEARNGEACQVRTETLSPQEMSEVTNPSFLMVELNPEDGLAALASLDMGSLLPQMDTISLESSCRCNYTSSRDLGFKFKLPAFENHCRQHFVDIYR